MAYLSSANVKVFPSAYRGSGIDPEARLNSERNLTLSLNSFADYNSGSFVLDYTNHILKFVIGGYYFEVTLDATYDIGTWYAHIKTVDRGGAGGAWACKSLANQHTTSQLIDVLDESSTFYGLEIDNNAIKTDCINLLLLYEGQVYSESKLKISSDSIGNQFNTANCAISDMFVTKAAYICDTEGALNIGPNTSTSKFSVQADSGDTAIAGTLRVTGATTLTSATLSSTLAVTGNTTLSGNTTLNAIANKDTTLANGSLFLGNGGTNGSISSSGNGVFGGTDGVVTNKLQAFGDNITLASNLIPTTAGTIVLGSYDKTFDSVWANEFHIPWGTLNEGLILSRNGTTEGSKIYSRGTLTLDCNSDLHLTTSNNTKYVYSDKKFIASAGIQSLANITIAANKQLDLSGTGEIKLKVEGSSTPSETYTISGNGIYAIVVDNSNYGISGSATLTLIPNYLTTVFAFLGNNTSNTPFVKATRTSVSDDTWTVTVYMSPSSQLTPDNWKVVKIASL